MGFYARGEPEKTRRRIAPRTWLALVACACVLVVAAAVLVAGFWFGFLDTTAPGAPVRHTADLIAKLDAFDAQHPKALVRIGKFGLRPHGGRGEPSVTSVIRTRIGSHGSWWVTTDGAGTETWTETAGTGCLLGREPTVVVFDALGRPQAITDPQYDGGSERWSGSETSYFRYED